MKKYTKPAIQIVELTVRESLSALPKGFTRGTMGKLGINQSTLKNITIYKSASAASL